MLSTDIAHNLGQRLRSQFEYTKGERVLLEDRWLRDLRQYKGIYDPEDEARMDKRRSRIFLRMTRIKIKTLDARLMDLMFPAGSEDNWSISPTPVADMPVDPAMQMQVMMNLQRPISPQEQQLLSQELAVKAAESMQQEIKDQLAEARYRQVMKEVIHSGNLYGTGVLKGPLVESRTRKAWVADPLQGWIMQETPVLRPYIEFVPLWDVYPDTGATSFADARFVFQRHVMSKHEVMGLADRSDFDRQSILDFVRGHPEGDAQFLRYEVDLRVMGVEPRTLATRKKRYEVLEYWGIVDASDLSALGVETDDPANEYWANIWLLGSQPIKAVLSPIDGVSLPYYAYYYDKDETSIFGEGLSSVMRDPQKGLNACNRAMFDNMAISAGLQAEVNVDLLAPGEDPRAIHPFRVWLRNGYGADAQYPAVRFLDTKSYTQEYLAVAASLEDHIHEATLPSYMHGEADKGVGRTVGGLSMLMGQAQTSMKDQLVSLDEDVVKPFIQAMYHWNMQFNPKPDIKGDFSVVVKGMSSLVAREMRAQNLEQFATSTLNPMDAQFVNREELLRQRAKVLELGDGIVFDPEDIARQQMVQAMLAQQQMMPGAPVMSPQGNPNANPTGFNSPMQGVPGVPGDASNAVPDRQLDAGAEEPAGVGLAAGSPVPPR